MRWFHLLFASVVVIATSALADPPMVGPETTYYLEPLDDEGYVDYVAALNAAFGDADAAPQNNAFVGILNQTFTFYPDLEHVEKLYATLGVKLPADDAPQFVRFLDYAENQGLPMAPPFDWQNAPFDAEAPPPPPGSADAMEERAYGEPWTAQELPEVSHWLDSIQDPLDAVVEATQRPAYYAPLIRSHPQATMIEVMLPQLGTHRAVGRSLSMRARRSVGEGDLDAAIADWTAMKRLAVLQKREPVLISNLVGISIQALSNDVFNLIVSQPALTAAHIEQMQQVLAHLPPGVDMADVIFRAERVSSLDLLTKASRGQVQILDIIRMMQSVSEQSEPSIFFINEREADPLTALISSPNFDLDSALRRINTAWDQWFGEIPDDFADFIDQLENTESEIEQIATKAGQNMTSLIMMGQAGIPEGADRKQIAEQTANLFLGILTPSLSAAITTERQSQTLAALEPVALALASYRLDHGNYPPLLQSLVPDYLDLLPTDPLGNKSLRYRRQADGYRLYSVGTNFTDDGGIHDFREGDIVLTVPWSVTE
ncbi:MAG: hypothetical protein AAF593_03600 [Planctomycetota bacterium]